MEARFPKGFLRRFGQDVATVAQSLEPASQELCQRLAGYPEEVLQRSCPGQTWSPLELLEHVVLVQQFFVQTLEASLQGEPVVVMAQGELSPQGKPVSPVATRPQAKVTLATLPHWLETLETSTEYLLQLANRLEPHQQHATSLQHGFLDALTNLEVLQTAAWHLHHHSKQLPAIA